MSLFGNTRQREGRGGCGPARCSRQGVPARGRRSVGGVVQALPERRGASGARERVPPALLATLLGAALSLPAASPDTLAYPLSGFEETGIRRLEAARLAHEGVVRDRKRLPGELLALEQVDIRLAGRPDLELPAPDPELGGQLVRFLGEEADRYSLAVLDLSDLEHPRYAEHNAEVLRNPGSVGKLAVGTGLFQALADAWPDDVERRRRVLRESIVTADEFIVADHHKVRIWHPGERVLERRPLEIGDRGNLWEWLDWMLSASSNAAAATVQKQAMLLARFGRRYPVDDRTGQRFFAETPPTELQALFGRTFVDALARNGIDTERFRQGSFFTRTGKRKVPGVGRSIATTRELMRFLLRLEQGRIVDRFSSRELKRLLYVTERRIRYASSPALNEAAVYFKSGSLYRCRPEPGFQCRKYHGNVENVMNSVAIVEAPAGAPRLFYMVTLTSNVLRSNSAVAHQTLATRIHRLLQKAHGSR